MVSPIRSVEPLQHTWQGVLTGRRISGGRSRRRASGIGAVLPLLLVCMPGCTFGPVSVPIDQFNYNEAITRAGKEQLLLNVVRLRYGDTPQVFELTSVLSQYTIETSGNWSFWDSDLNTWRSPALRAVYGVDGDPGKATTWGAGIKYTDRPTLTYQPLRGEEYMKKLMTPIDPLTVFYLVNTGWGFDTILRCCVQRINDLDNTPLSMTANPEQVANIRFLRVAQLLRLAQDTNALNFAVEVEKDAKEPDIYLRGTGRFAKVMPDEARELAELLDLDPTVTRFQLSSAPLRRSRDEIALVMRSPLGVMTALAREFSTPAAHKNVVYPGLERPEEGDVLSLLDIKNLPTPVPGAFVAVRYRGYWFYIDDTDLSSKRTLALLTYLLSMQSEAVREAATVLALPAG